MSESSPLLAWREPALGWCVAGIALGTGIISLAALIPDEWLPIQLGLQGDLVMVAFGLLWMSLAAGLCALKGRRRVGLTRGDVVVCFPLAAFALIAFILVFGALASVAPTWLQPVVYAVGALPGIAAMGGVMVMLWGLPLCAAAAWAFSIVAFTSTTRQD